MTSRFALPIDISRLENERMRLEPVETDLQRFYQTYHESTLDNPELFTWLPYGPWKSPAEAETWYQGRFGGSSTEILFSIFLKTGTIRKRSPEGSENDYEEFEVQNDTFAGFVGLLDADPRHASVEIGHICILPRFQRTFVGTHANGLLLRHCLDPLPQDLHMRRVTWQANANNKPSVGAAERLGFKLEGIVRWQRVLPEGKAGPLESNQPLEDKVGRKLGPGRHSAMLGLCWDDWVDGGRERIDQMMRA